MSDSRTRVDAGMRGSLLDAVMGYGVREFRGHLPELRRAAGIVSRGVKRVWNYPVTVPFPVIPPEGQGVSFPKAPLGSFLFPSGTVSWERFKTESSRVAKSMLAKSDPIAAIGVAAYDVIGSFSRALSRELARESAGGAPAGAGAEYVKSQEASAVPAPLSSRFDEGTDRYVIAKAMEDLASAGGPTNTEAVTEFHARTAGIRNRAVRRLFPQWNNGIPFETASAAARNFKGTPEGDVAAKALQDFSKKFNEMNPMDWLEEGGR